MPDDINNLDSEDVGLKQIFGERFHDKTKEPPKGQEKAQIPNVNIGKRKQENEMKIAAEMAEIRKRTNKEWIDPLKECVKWVALFGGLNLLIFYWQQTGQMAASAAVPSMCVCCVLAGLFVGMNIKRGNR